MHERLWSDRELREFLSALREGGFLGPGEPVDAEVREAFAAQADLRIGAEVARRALAEVGAVVDRGGVAHVALRTVDGCSSAEHTWLLVTTDPWGFLADLVAKEIREAHRAVHPRGDGKRLAGIEEASTRRELDAR